MRQEVPEITVSRPETEQEEKGQYQEINGVNAGKPGPVEITGSWGETCRKLVIIVVADDKAAKCKKEGHAVGAQRE